eukprot:1159874-Pelagomonas_calceolata.AAC.2
MPSRRRSHDQDPTWFKGLTCVHASKPCLVGRDELLAEIKAERAERGEARKRAQAAISIQSGWLLIRFEVAAMAGTCYAASGSLRLFLLQLAYAHGRTRMRS